MRGVRRGLMIAVLWACLLGPAGTLCAQSPGEPSAETVAALELSNKIRQLLKSDFSITDSALMDEVTKKVLAKLEQLK